MLFFTSDLCVDTGKNGEVAFAIGVHRTCLIVMDILFLSVSDYSCFPTSVLTLLIRFPNITHLGTIFAHLSSEEFRDFAPAIHTKN